MAGSYFWSLPKYLLHWHSCSEGRWPIVSFTVGQWRRIIQQIGYLWSLCHSLFPLLMPPWLWLEECVFFWPYPGVKLRPMHCAQYSDMVEMIQPANFAKKECKGEPNYQRRIEYQLHPPKLLTTLLTTTGKTRALMPCARNMKWWMKYVAVQVALEIGYIKLLRHKFGGKVIGVEYVDVVIGPLTSADSFWLPQ